MCYETTHATEKFKHTRGNRGN